MATQVAWGKGIVALFALALAAGPAEARPDARSGSSGSFRTVLVIDASGSMRKTDPRKLRHVAAELFVDLARHGDRIAVTAFDGGVRESTGGFTAVDGIEAREELKRAIRATGDDGAWTDFVVALGEARRLLEADGPNPDGEDLIVLLTDGKCEQGRGIPEQPCLDTVMNEMVPALRGVRIFPIGLSKWAPAAFLEDLGRRTGGAGATALDARELPMLFAEVYARLLGSRLVHGTVGERATFEVHEGAETLDLVVMGRFERDGELRDPGGRGVAIDNRHPERAYFAAGAEYRFFKIAGPDPGTWTIEVEPGGPRPFVALQHFDLDLELVSAPEAVELGQPLELSARLSSSGAAVPPAAFLDRHRLHAVVEAGDREERLEMERDGDGWTLAAPTRALGTATVRLSLEPGADGVLSRETGVLASIAVVPPIRLSLAAGAAGPVKQGETGPGWLDFEGSEIGADLRVEVAGEPLAVAPAVLAVAAEGARRFEIEIAVPRAAAGGSSRVTVTAVPVAPAGFEDRAVTAELVVEVVPLTFWERHGRKVLAGAGILLFLLLAFGIFGPARFPRRAILYYMDLREPDLERRSSYPIGTRARRGFYRGASVRVGPTGPVKRGGAVLLTALSGGAVSARPLVSGAKVHRAPREDEDALPGDDRPEVPLRDGAFRVTPGARYEIEGAGLRFWIQT
jgi:Mg-chelatase subunit ChlD